MRGKSGSDLRPPCPPGLLFGGEGEGEPSADVGREDFRAGTSAEAGFTVRPAAAPFAAAHPGQGAPGLATPRTARGAPALGAAVPVSVTGFRGRATWSGRLAGP